MAALSSFVVTNRTTSGCTVTFNAASLDLRAGQAKALAALFTHIAYAEAGSLQSQAAPFTITIPATLG